MFFEIFCEIVGLNHTNLLILQPKIGITKFKEKSKLIEERI